MNESILRRRGPGVALLLTRDQYLSFLPPANGLLLSTSASSLNLICLLLRSSGENAAETLTLPNAQRRSYLYRLWRMTSGLRYDVPLSVPPEVLDR